VIANSARSIAGMSLTLPPFITDPTSAVAENWPLVSPYTPLFSMM
jgi:hypothetical protein